jgi:WD40 repeat protein
VPPPHTVFLVALNFQFLLHGPHQAVPAMVAVLASCGGNQVSLWNIPGDDAPIVSFRPEYVPDSSYGDDGADVTCLCFNKTAQILAASTASGIVSIYSQNGALHDTLRPDEPLVDGNAEIPISCISFSSNALSLCSGGEDRILRLWDCKRKETVKVVALLDTAAHIMCTRLC